MTHHLTEGNIRKALLSFSAPMILGNLLQQLYNVADTLIVAKTLGPTALSAVGSSYALMVLFTSVLLGFCMGSGVVFAQLYGAQCIQRMKTAVFNAFCIITCLTLVLNTMGFLFLDQFIVWLHVPAQAAAYTKEYLQVIFVGMAAVSVYNFLAAVLRSTGNTLVPLVFLAISAVVNIVLDYIFIVFFHMGVSGAAWATVAAQALSALCMVVYFFSAGKALCPGRQHCKLEKSLLHALFTHSALTAVQQSVMNFGILMVQGLVNSFGFYASAAFAVVVKIDAFAYMPAQDFGNAFSTFIAQNCGAKQHKRITAGVREAGWMSAAFCVASSLFVCLFAAPLMQVFVGAEQTEIIRIGVQYLFIEGSCYVGIGILFLLYGFYRGLGKPGMSVLLTVISLGSRVALAYLLSSVPAFGLAGIWWAIPIGWLLADIIGILYGIRKKGLIQTCTASL